MLHEYGHHILSFIYSSRGLDGQSLGGSHAFCTMETPDLAWDEGYAEIFGILMSKELKIFDNGEGKIIGGYVGKESLIYQTDEDIEDYLIDENGEFDGVYALVSLMDGITEKDECRILWM